VQGDVAKQRGWADTSGEQVQGSLRSGMERMDAGRNKLIRDNAQKRKKESPRKRREVNRHTRQEEEGKKESSTQRVNGGTLKGSQNCLKATETKKWDSKLKTSI